MAVLTRIPPPVGEAPSRRRRRRRHERTTITGLRRSLHRHWTLYVLMVVPLIWFVVFKYIPMSNAVLAFKSFNVIKGIWGSPWVAELRPVLPEPGVLDPGEEHLLAL